MKSILRHDNFSFYGVRVGTDVLDGTGVELAGTVAVGVSVMVGDGVGNAVGVVTSSSR